MGEKFMVLGSNSFSGSHFVSFLLQAGHEVMGVSRSPEPLQVFRPYAWGSMTGEFSFRQVDINDADSLGRVFDEFRPRIVVNFAAQSMVAQSWDFPEHWYETNVLALVKLAKILQASKNLHRYVHVTTPEVYGSTGGWITENTSFAPSTPYAISRAAGDMHMMALHETQGLPVLFTRAANVFGPGQRLYRIIPRTLLSARLGRRLTLDGGGQSTRSFIHITDVSQATYLIAMTGTPGVSYHISTDEIVSIRDLVMQACTLTGADFSSLVVEGPERLGKDDTYMLNSVRLRQDLGWEPRVTLERGLRDTLDWIDANLTLLADLPTDYIHRR